MPTFGPPEFPGVGTVDDRRIQGHARVIASHLLRREPITSVYEPGNGYHYEALFVPSSATSTVALKNEGYYPMSRWLERGRGVVLVGLISNGCYPFHLLGRPRDDLLHPTYVAEKLDCTVSDAAVMANLMTEIGVLTGERQRT